MLRNWDLIIDVPADNEAQQQEEDSQLGDLESESESVRAPYRVRKAPVVELKESNLRRFRSVDLFLCKFTNCTVLAWDD